MTATTPHRVKWPWRRQHAHTDAAAQATAALVASNPTVIDLIVPVDTRPVATWSVTIAARGDGEPVTPVEAARFAIALHEPRPEVSTASGLAKTCYYEARVTVQAQGVLTAVIHAIGRFQAAARAVGLPEVRIVGVTATKESLAAPPPTTLAEQPDGARSLG